MSILRRLFGNPQPQRNVAATEYTLVAMPMSRSSKRGAFIGGIGGGAYIKRPYRTFDARGGLY